MWLDRPRSLSQAYLGSLIRRLSIVVDDSNSRLEWKITAGFNKKEGDDDRPLANREEAAHKQLETRVIAAIPNQQLNTFFVAVGRPSSRKEVWGVVTADLHNKKRDRIGGRKIKGVLWLYWSFNFRVKVLYFKFIFTTIITAQTFKSAIF